MTTDVANIRAAVRRALAGDARTLLAVSGGVDSMVLLDAAAAVCRHDRLLVATYDHGTGTAAVRAADSVVERCRLIGVECVHGRATGELRSEAELRDARWAFLRAVAREQDAVIATAHNEDDQVETVLMRLMRGAGARGLAGLYAATEVRRPLIGFSRDRIVAYARARELTWIDDPSNASRSYLRNRLRLDLLPALLKATPSLRASLLAIAVDAADWRRDVEALIAALIQVDRHDEPGTLDVAAEPLLGQPTEALGWIWPAVAARAGLVLDRRAIARLANFTLRGRVGSRIQLAGGWTVVRARDAFEFRHVIPDEPRAATLTTLTLSNDTAYGDWAFRPLDRLPANVANATNAVGGAATGTDRAAWTAWLPCDQPLSVRSWQPGDAMRVRPGGSTRKVKRLLADAGVTGIRRAGWPVVLSGDQIVWVPGVRRGDAATARSGRPGLAFRCDNLIESRVRGSTAVGAKSPSDRL